MSETYSYNISTDFPGGSINSGKLHVEINASAIATVLEHVSTQGGVANIVFGNTLSAGDKILLDNNENSPSGGLIAAHDYSPLINSTEFMAVSEDTNSTTTTDLQTKVTHVFTPINDGWHILEWYVEYKTSHYQARVKLCVQENGVSTCGEVDSHPDTISNTGWGAWNGKCVRQLDAGTEYTYNMIFASTKNGKLITVRRARLMLMEHPNG